MSYDYASRTVWLDDLHPEVDPNDYDLCPSHADRLGGDQALLQKLVDEFNLTVEMILRIRRKDELLSDNEVLKTAIALRNPYVDALSVIQISQLAHITRGNIVVSQIKPCVETIGFQTQGDYLTYIFCC